MTMIATTTSPGPSSIVKSSKSNVSIKCEHRGCSCDSFIDGNSNKRICENCKHGWVIHGMFITSFHFFCLFILISFQIKSNFKNGLSVIIIHRD